MKTNTFIRMVTKGIEIIRKEAISFVPTQKTGYDGVDDDLVTSADFAAQDFYQKELEAVAPRDGIIGEEKLNKKSKNGNYFTIDPLDGTQAFGRKQSIGVGTMLAHVTKKGEVDMACVGDVNTGEIFYYDAKTIPTRIRFDRWTDLPTATLIPIQKLCVVLREHTENHPDILQDMCRKERGGIFGNINIESGSIGIKMSRLWKDEVGMIILMPHHNTPWDSAPFIGMNKKLNIVHIALDPMTLKAEVFEPVPTKEIVYRSNFELITRKEYVPAVLGWIEEWKKKHA
ncbi:MAG: inositol monophosphatase family protein [Patescibacteria group bacterium]